MKTKDIYLNYYEVMILEQKLLEIRKENPYFKSGLVDQFESLVLETTVKQNRLFQEKELFMLLPSYKLPRSLVNYIINLTEINILDSKEFKKNKKLIKEINKNMGSLTK